MANNPVSAFLVGFNVVDNLETNRQARSFREEQQSRLKTIWKREDDEFSRTEKKRMQHDNMVKFQAFSDQLMSEIPKDKSDEWFTNETSRDGKPVGPTKFMNELMKRMVSANPEFGEALALSHGFDAGAGPLVNGQRPVAGVGLVPTELDPKGQGGFIFELNTQRGDQQPATVNRTSADNDPISMTQPTMSGMVELFGEEFLGNQYQIATQIRSMFEPDGPTGSPFASVDAGAAKSEGAVVDGEATEVAPEPEAPVVAAEDSFAAAHGEPTSGRENAPPPGMVNPPVAGKHPTMSYDNTIAARETFKDPNASLTSRGVSFLRLMANDMNSWLNSRGGEAPTPEQLAAAQKQIDAIQEDPVSDTLVQFFDELRTGEKSDATMQDKMEGVANAVYNVVAGKEDKVESGGFSGTKPRDEAATTIADVRSDGANPSQYSAKNLSKPGDTALAAGVNAAAPSSVEAAQSMAGNIASTKRHRPSIPQLYNAVGLAKAGVLSPEQLHNYARTGMVDIPADNIQLFNMGLEGGIVAVDKGSLQSAQVVPGQARAGAVDSDLDIFNAQKSLIENRREYQDRDGNVDDAKVQQALEQIETASDALGLSQTQRQDRSILSSMSQGQLLVDRFSADPSQTFDFNPFSDPELGPNNMALGFVADQLGITEQEDADRFLFDYGITFRNAARGLNTEELIKEIIRAELEVRQRGGNRNAERTKIVKEGLGE